MRESNDPIVSLPAVGAQDVLTSILRDGAQRLLTHAIEAEVAEWIDEHRHVRNEQGHCQVVRNGHLPERTLVTGVGPVQVKQPRVLDRRPAGEAEPFPRRSCRRTCGRRRASRS
jgi:putative transposase